MYAYFISGLLTEKFVHIFNWFMESNHHYLYQYKVRYLTQNHPKWLPDKADSCVTLTHAMYGLFNKTKSI